MGVVAEDLNSDGRIDLFHTNFINQSNTLRWNLGGNACSLMGHLPRTSLPRADP